MRNITLSALLMLMSASLGVATASPRLWPSYSNRWDQSDLVAIGRLLKTEDTQETNMVGRVPGVGTLSDFKLLLVMKGHCTQDVVRVAHYRRRDPPRVVDSVMTTVGPQYSFVQFENPIDRSNPTEADYVLFLKRAANNGLWLPATGRIDPVWSFLKLSQCRMTQEAKRAAEQ